ncbi:MAG: DNA-directed RNA polymerase subunit beta' [Candidatus Omnitrophica bacterium]|nr:DNA-directed RNA polymerase subunit beta' [Candidatus Omnitrophota bacterium]
MFEKYGIEEIHLSSPRSKLITRFKLLESFITNNIKPEWMILQNLPILPPDLRPLVAIEGGKFASSDLNELYRRIIHRNNRLKKFCGRGDKKDNVESKGIPKLVLLNEKRLLQEAIDALIENSARKNPIINSQKRPLKSLTDILKGKQGRFRQNLLGKRIDYSGRSAIVVGPELKLYQCGLPKEMAFELFKPFILHRLMKKYNVSLKKAKNMLQTDNPEIWDIVEEVAKHHPVLLNRAPTLHRPSIQAFEPVLVEGKAIQIHPMVCTPYNADFDGDQMAVYVPLTLEAQIEAKLIMKSYFNLFSPANGKPLIGPTQDVVLGISYMTTEKPNEKGEGMIFSSQEEVIHAYQQGFVGLNAKIKVLGLNDLKENTKVEEWKDYTTVGRIIFNTILPEEISLFKDKSKNKAYGKKALFELVEECYQKCGLYQTVIFLDKMKTLGYHYATISGFTISVDDMLIPQNKQKEIDIAWEKVKEIEKQAKEGVITEIERYNSIIDIWSETIEKITKQLQQEMEKQNKEKIKEGKAKFNSVYLMANSGARGNIDQVKQLSAIRGLMSRPQRKIKGEIGEIIETPITSNFREGLNILEYFISTHGGRKGLSDTALKTSEAGYLTRRLADVAHHVVVTEEDCKTIKGIKVSALKIGDETIETLEDRIIGRVALQDIVIDTIDEKTAEIHPKIIAKSGQMISKQQTHEIIKAGIESIRIRSVLTCEAKNGVCAKCYGMDFSTGELVKVGEAVGVIAAQSIGEPGTQLTLRTFHIGGATARLVKQPKIVAPFEGEVEHHKLVSISKKNANGQEVLIVLTSDATIRLINKEKGLKQDWKLPYGSRVYIKNKSFIEKGTLIAEWDAYSIPIIAEKDGIIKYRDLIEGKTYVIEHRHAAGGIEERQVLPYRGRYNPGINIVNIHNKIIATYSLPVDSIILVKENDTVKAGDVIAKIPREEIKTKDITGGLPRVEELFEARHPQESAVLSEIDGVVKIETREQKDTDNIETIIKIINETSKKEIEYKIPAGRHLLVYDGDRVESGEPLTDGVIDPHKYLEIRGPQHTQELLLNEIQQVYRLQGVNINDKHIETIIKQMLSFVRIIDPGLPPKSTKSKKFYEFIYGEIVPKKLFEEEVEKIEQERKNLIKSGDSKEAAQLRPPKAEPILLGISRVASSSESFLSSASFQETSRVLTEAALEGKVDNLTGLKENVIIGRLIPAGTGFYSEETVSLNKEIKVSEKILI